MQQSAVPASKSRLSSCWQQCASCSRRHQLLHASGDEYACTACVKAPLVPSREASCPALTPAMILLCTVWLQPKFLTKKEREELALKRREEEAALQRAK